MDSLALLVSFRTPTCEISVQDLILTLHIIVCVLLVVLILLQSGKEGMGVIFGGGNSSVFGSTGAGGILAKLTTLMAIIFVITSLSYTYVTSERPSSESAIIDVRIEEPAAPKETAPAAPSETAPEATEPTNTPSTSTPTAPAPEQKPAASDTATQQQPAPAQ